MGSETFSEFLIPVKFKLDEHEKKKFDAVIAETEKRFKEIGTAATAAAAALFFAVREISKNLSSLAYAAERVGASSEELKALENAAVRVGIGADAAKSSLSAFFAFVNFEGGASAIKQWFNTGDFDPMHPLKVFLDSAVKLSDEYAKGGVARQTAIVEGRRAGYNDALITTPGAARRLRDEMEKDEAFTGGKLNPIAEKAKRLNAEFEKVKQHLEDISELVSGSLMDAFSDLLEEADGWLKAHKEDIKWFSDQAADLAKNILDVTKGEFKLLARLEANTSELMRTQDIINDIREALKWLGDGSIASKINAALEWAFQPFKWLWDKLQKLLWEKLHVGPVRAGGFGVGEGTESGGHGATRRGKFGHGGGHAGDGTGSPGKPNANFTAENAKALRESAARIGTTPEDLATVIGYETGGTFSPSKWGGAGGRYMGLIQFGPPERAQYGANENQTFKEQLGAVERYLKDRGYKPGMGINDLYSTILAGRPGLNRADSGGTVNEHVERMKVAHRARALLFLKSGEVPAASATQGVIPGQSDPHKPGFDPSSVKFHDYFPEKHSSRFPLGHRQFASNEHHDNRSLHSNIEIKVAGASPIDRTAHPLERTKNATLIRNTTATAS